MSGIPDESTLTPDAVQRALSESQRDRRRADTLIETARSTFGRNVELGATNGFTEGLRNLIRGSAA